MNRDSYLAELNDRLSKLPYSEKEEAMRYYTEYFNEAGPQAEVAVIDELGPPYKIAAQILGEFASGRALASERETSREKRQPNLLLILAGILAAPVALPLGFAAVVFILCMILAMALVAFSIALAAAACILAGIATAVIGFGYFAMDFATLLTALGAGFAVAGIGVLMLIPVKALFRLMMRFASACAAKIFNRIKGV